jgi:hypothetical protein
MARILVCADLRQQGGRQCKVVNNAVLIAIILRQIKPSQLGAATGVLLYYAPLFREHIEDLTANGR